LGFLIVIIFCAAQNLYGIYSKIAHKIYSGSLLIQ
jgi:hypothetical protein